MRSLLLTAMLMLCGCSAEQPAPKPIREHRVVVPDHSLDAFGGRLYGTNRGEWIGQLTFQDADGDLETVLNENVHGIVENPEGIFVFTGLAHLSANEGYIYILTRAAEGPVVATPLGRLPGAPKGVAQLQRGGATYFLVRSGHHRNGDALFECYRLVGKIVDHGNDCLPPKRPGRYTSRLAEPAKS